MPMPEVTPEVSPQPSGLMARPNRDVTITQGDI